MQKTEPKTLPGFMELLPEDQILFNKLKDTIKESYELYGYSPLDTPIIEDADVLLAKTGGETNRQIYSFTKGENDLALRFDLTVPLAKYVSLYQNELSFPFKRYQIGKVYRGEKAQRGRYREFYQCDIDVIGKDELSLYADAEIVATIESTFKKLDIGEIMIKVNNRKVLTGLLQEFSLQEKGTEILRIVDKIDKVGKDETKDSLKNEGMKAEQIEELMKFVAIEGNPLEVISKLKKLKISNEEFQKGVNELEEVSNYIQQLDVSEKVWKIDLSIARGLDYYTGTVYETVLIDYPEIGAVCSGGRFDDLATYYTDQKLPGVGVSIGLTRLFFQLREAEIVKSNQKTPTQILVIPLGKNIDISSSVAKKLRDKGISTQVYLGNDTSMGKMLSYANDVGMPWVVIIGDDERASEKYALKNMISGEQTSLSVDEVVETIQKK